VRAATSGIAGIVVSPTCLPFDDDLDTPETRDVDVGGHGFEPGTTVDIYVGTTFESEQLPVARAQVGRLGTFEARVPVFLPGQGTTGIPIAAVTVGQEGPVARVELETPCRPTLRVSPACADADQPFDLTFDAEGFRPDTEIQVGIVVEPNGIVSEPLTTDGNGRLEFTFEGIGPLPAGVYQAAAVQGAGGARMRIAASAVRQLIAATPIELPCPEPVISLTPDCGRVGAPQDRYAVTVTGSGFLPGPLTITWDVGGSEEEFPTRIGNEAGTFEARIDPWRRARMRIRVRVTQLYPVGSDTPEGVGSYATEGRPRRIATAVFRVPCPPSVLTLDPECDRPALQGEDERRIEMDVRATGIRAVTAGASPIAEIVFDAGEAAADVVAPERFPVDLGRDGDVSTTITPLARPVGEYQVALVVDGQTAATTIFRVPCTEVNPNLRPLQPDCIPLAPGRPAVAELRVRGRRYYPGPVEVVVARGGATDLQLGTVGANGEFDVRVPVTGREPGTYPVVGRQRDSRGTIVARASREMTVPCVDPAITIRPASGPAGYATFVTGTDFPPGTTVTLTWDKGLTARRPVEVTTDAAGAFRVGVYLLPHDLEGPRTMTAGMPDDPDAFPGVTAPYLVVPGSGQPPGSVDRR
jgi:hypothetical protein